MNEIYDKLILRIIFVLYLCLLILFYRYCYEFIYKIRNSNKILLKHFGPEKKPAETIHLMSKILGIGILLSGLSLDLSLGLVSGIFLFTTLGLISFFSYIISIYIVESIILYNFEYKDEILGQNNMSYAIISAAISLSCAYLVSYSLSASHYSLPLFVLIWLFGLVIIGVGFKCYPLASQMPFNTLLTQKNLGISFSFSGFILGLSLIIVSAISRPIEELNWYAVQIVLKIILAMLIAPLLVLFITKIFKIRPLAVGEYRGEEALGHGIYEGVLFFTTALLTKLITAKIIFGEIYPQF